MIYFVTQYNKEELLELIRLSKDSGTSAILFSSKDSAQRFLSEVYRTRNCRGLRIIELSITDISGTLEESYDLINSISSIATPLMVEFKETKVTEDGK